MKILPNNTEFQYVADSFADLRILRYQVPNFEQLNLQQKKMLFCLQEAALWGNDIFFDQNYRNNISIKLTLEAAIRNFNGDKNSENWKNWMNYTKRFWFSKGVHHHNSTDKFFPDFSKSFFEEIVVAIPENSLPLKKSETKKEFIARISNIIFNTSLDTKAVCFDPNKDIILESSNNFYAEDITQKEVEDFYKKMVDKNDPRPISYGLNSKLVRENGELVEKKWKLGGLYSSAIEKIIFWLSEAKNYSENNGQKTEIEKLIEYYQTGDLKTFDEYSVAWVQNSEPIIDFTNGFIEVYGDPMGSHGSYQSMVYVKDLEMTKKVEAISQNAKWFEENSPISANHKKDEVKGIFYKVINAVVAAGDCAPCSPLGVNLPNADWIREEFGSKSVSLGNIETAYDEASKSSGSLQEFFLPEQQVLIKKHGLTAGKLHTGLHEVIGHGSGKLEPNVAPPNETLKNYSSALEEARADLVALYFLPDSHLVKIGLTEEIDVGYAEYCGYIVNGLMRQLVRLNEGEIIEQAHMRGRSMISHWCFEKGEKEKVIEKLTIDKKTFFVINDYQKLRELFGKLLKEVQRIKSQGDFEAGKNLMEIYGSPVDKNLHKEVKQRYKKLGIPPFSGFIQPQLEKVIKNGKWEDVKLNIPSDFTKQMMFYADNYSSLSTENI